MKIAAFCDKDTAIGLRLAGIKDTYIADKKTSDLWNEIIQNEEIGLLFITEKIAEELDKTLKDFRLKNNIPIIVEISDKNGRKKEHIDYISHLIKKAVGVEIGNK